MSPRDYPYFNRTFFNTPYCLSVLGEGEIGGKADGLFQLEQHLPHLNSKIVDAGISIDIPKAVVLRTQVFEDFLRQNKLEFVIQSSSFDDNIVRAFLKSSFPVYVLGDLKYLVREVKRPLAIRSSSLLEDQLNAPFAGIYATKMIPNNQPDPDVRFKKLIETIKFVYASTFFTQAQNYARAANIDFMNEKMAVIIQEVVGEPHGHFFYPEISGVMNSINFYAFGHGKPDDGVIHLAFGLGQTIVQDGVSWSYSPAFPMHPPPFNSPEDQLKVTQKSFWSVYLGPVERPDPLSEFEFMVKKPITELTEIESLKLVASTWDASSQKIYPGVYRKGPKVIDFAPILRLEQIPLNNVLTEILDYFKKTTGQHMEFEFAFTTRKDIKTARLALLQMRPMKLNNEQVTIEKKELESSDLLVYSGHTLGNGLNSTIKHIMYVEPDEFEIKDSQKIAECIRDVNRFCMEHSIYYLLIVPGRIGTSDPWLGIPVNWGDISNVRAIVEMITDRLNVDLSLGSHFFHNLNNLGVMFFSVSGKEDHISLQKIRACKQLQKNQCVYLLEAEDGLLMKIDGTQQHGIILKQKSSG
ncbi:MAG: hypothetical protein Kow00108_01780 [Calditrichia bacterium]